MSRTRSIFATLLIACTAAVGRAQPTAATLPATTRAATSQPFLAEIERFEAADAQHMPAPGGIVFFGSSTIRKWDTAAAFPKLPTINRGFGGSHMADAALYVRRVATKYRPKLVVLYEGDNDLAAGKTPAQVMESFRVVADAIHADVPTARLLVIAVKSSVVRERLQPRMDELNALFREAVAKDTPWMSYVDLSPLIVDPATGKARPELFEPDGLHLSSAGYALWNKQLEPKLVELTRE